jgi:hypothetical protein
MMSIDQLFNALPRDLQWEILSEFVGTHAVRKGKLMRKLVEPFQHSPLKFDMFHNDKKVPWRYSKYGTISIHPEIPCFLSEAVNILSYGKMSDGSMMMYCESTITRKTSYIFRTATKMVQNRPTWDHERYLIDDSKTIEPFIKHNFASYPYTNKKMGRKS